MEMGQHSFPGDAPVALLHLVSNPKSKTIPIPEGLATYTENNSAIETNVHSILWAGGPHIMLQLQWRKNRAFVVRAVWARSVARRPSGKACTPPRAAATAVPTVREAATLRRSEAGLAPACRLARQDTPFVPL